MCDALCQQRPEGPQHVVHWLKLDVVQVAQGACAVHEALQLRMAADSFAVISTPTARVKRQHELQAAGVMHCWYMLWTSLLGTVLPTIGAYL
jgi:hypothetical protein